MCIQIQCDLLIPAAKENQITKEIAEGIRTSLIVEGANGPTLTEADVILEKKGVTVVPDILANAGGVCVSYFEYIQDIHSYFWKIDRINQELKNILVNAFEDVYCLSLKKNISLRIAAYIISISRLEKAIQLRGIFP